MLDACDPIQKGDEAYHTKANSPGDTVGEWLPLCAIDNAIGRTPAHYVGRGILWRRPQGDQATMKKLLERIEELETYKVVADNEIKYRVNLKVDLENKLRKEQDVNMGLHRVLDANSCKICSLQDDLAQTLEEKGELMVYVAGLERVNKSNGKVLDEMVTSYERADSERRAALRELNELTSKAASGNSEYIYLCDNDVLHKGDEWARQSPIPKDWETISERHAGSLKKDFCGCKVLVRRKR
jgi:hypothetical protein